MAAAQDEFGDHAVTGVVSMSSDGDVHFEAFQVGLPPFKSLPALTLLREAVDFSPSLIGYMGRFSMASFPK